MPVTVRAPSASDGDQAEAPPSGSVEVSTFPALSPVAQKADEGHEIAVREWVASTTAFVQAAVPPVGLVEVSRSPALSVTRQ
jgi:hypothetical protein